MAGSSEPASPDARSPETTDRLMVGVCGAIWLVLLAVSSIATVALVQLGRGQERASAESDSSWLLYTVIVISALVIVGAIPLLLRARRTAMAQSGASGDSGAPKSPESPEKPLDEPAPPPRPVDAPTEKLRVFGAAVDPYRRKPAQHRKVSRISVVLERIWLRGTTSLVGAMGLALTAVATATYLLATHTETAAWVALGVAAVITVGMVGILVIFQRRIAHAADAAADHALA